MFERPISDFREATTTALAELRAESGGLTGQDLIDELKFLKSLERQVQYESLRTIARLVNEGEFEKRAVRPAAAVADLLRTTAAEARRLVATATAVLPASLLGEQVEPKLPATATALGGYEIDQAHAAVIDRALSTSAAERIGPERWTGVEVQLADWARIYPPDQLAHLARQLIDNLDQDGPAPDDRPQVNELQLSRFAEGGGRIKGQLDAPTYDVVARAIRASLLPEADEGNSLGERQAAALGAICEHALDDGHLPADGGQRPHITAVLDYDRLVERGRGAILEFGGYSSAAQLRRILCDSCVTPTVLGGDGVPLDLGRTRRTASPAQRAALAARDGGCAHPGCAKTPSWCSAHHVIHWVDGGPTDLDNLVFLCLQHHIMVHQSGWTIMMRNGLPEFIPPKWLDIGQEPRSNRYLTLV
jgi:5-methylcytosine-specific restriction protein A